MNDMMFRKIQKLEDKIYDLEDKIEALERKKFKIMGVSLVISDQNDEEEDYDEYV